MAHAEREKTMKIEIREMVFEDCPQAAQVEQACFLDPWSLESFESLFSYGGNHYFTAWEEGRIVGFLGLMAVDGEADLTNVAVMPDARGRGVGNALLSHALAYAKAHGICQVMLEVRVSNKAAIRLYEKHGFYPVGRRKNYYRNPTEDAHLMCRRE